MRRLLDFLASLSLFSTYSISGTVFYSYFVVLLPPDATFQLMGANQEESWNIRANHYNITLHILHPQQNWQGTCIKSFSLTTNSVSHYL